VLVKNKINIADHIEDGKYNTLDTAKMLREDSGKASSEALRPSLVLADPSVPLTSVSDIITSAKSALSKSKYVLEEEKSIMTKKLDAVESALNKKFPSGMKLSELHDEKILRGTKTQRSPIGDVATNRNAQVNEVLRDTLQNMVENKAPKDIPVNDFNKVLTSQYKAADYLDQLHGKAKASGIFSKIAKTSAKVVGATLGGETGGLLAGVGGYHLGGMIESLFENMPANTRALLLRNLEIENPEAFKSVESYMTNKGVELSQQKALPPASYIPMGEKTPSESFVKSMEPEKQVYRDPKTGKFQRGYTSGVKGKQK
jgi:hypothetical protein